jgi:hypothetical protein
MGDAVDSDFWRVIVFAGEGRRQVPYVHVLCTRHLASERERIGQDVPAEPQEGGSLCRICVRGDRQAEANYVGWVGMLNTVIFGALAMDRTPRQRRDWERLAKRYPLRP